MQRYCCGLLLILVSCLFRKLTSLAAYSKGNYPSSFNVVCISTFILPINRYKEKIVNLIFFFRIVDVWDIHKSWLEEVGCHVSLGAVVGARDPPTSQTFTCIVDAALTTHPHQYTLTIQANKVIIYILGTLKSGAY